MNQKEEDRSRWWVCCSAVLCMWVGVFQGALQVSRYQHFW